MAMASTWGSSSVVVYCCSLTELVTVLTDCLLPPRYPTKHGPWFVELDRFHLLILTSMPSLAAIMRGAIPPQDKRKENQAAQ